MSDVISTVSGHISSDAIPADAQTFTTFENQGHSNIIKGNLLARYAYKAFSLTLSANVFNNNIHSGDTSDHYTYYNISLNPYFNIPDGWSGSFCLTYYSKVKQNSATLSDCPLATVIIGKRWGNLSLHLYSETPLHKRALDVTQSGDYRTERLYEMLASTVGVGMKYMF